MIGEVVCIKCPSYFKRTTRLNKVCPNCIEKTHQRSREQKPSQKKLFIISVNNSEGKFAGFIKAKSKRELSDVKLPRGYKMFGTDF